MNLDVVIRSSTFLFLILVQSLGQFGSSGDFFWVWLCSTLDPVCKSCSFLQSIMPFLFVNIGAGNSFLCYCRLLSFCTELLSEEAYVHFRPGKFTKVQWSKRVPECCPDHTCGYFFADRMCALRFISVNWLVSSLSAALRLYNLGSHYACWWRCKLIMFKQARQSPRCFMLENSKVDLIAAQTLS